MDKRTVLVVDDEVEIRRALEMALKPRGYNVTCVGSGEDALTTAVMERPDLIILDLALPEVNGLEVCRRLREWSLVPIIVLSVRNQERDKIAALDLGADDYVTKLFAMGELLARMRAALRRYAGDVKPEPTKFDCRSLHIDFPNRRVTVKGDEVRLTPREYDLLHYMVQHADRIITHRQLLTAVWSADVADDKPLLRVHIANLRQKIEPVPSRPTYIINEPGVGYRFTTGNGH